MTLRVLLGRRFADADIAYLKAHVGTDVAFVEPVEYSAAGIGDALAAGADVLLGEPPAEDVLARATGLRLIQIPWTGVDRLDFPALKRAGVPVSNSHSNGEVVAEFALALALSSLKGLPYHDALLRQGVWARPGAETFRAPMRIAGARALVLGLGAIGTAVGEKLAALGMVVDAMTARPRTAPSWAGRIVEPKALGDAISETDLVMVCLPLTEQTRGLIGEDLLRRMKPTAHLVNVARGEIIDEDALYKALDERWIGGAAIDTWYRYPRPGEASTLPSSKHPFERLNNLILSPHRAGFADDAFPHLDDVIDNLNRLAAGQPPAHQIDLDRGY